MARATTSAFFEYADDATTDRGVYAEPLKFFGFAQSGELGKRTLRKFSAHNSGIVCGACPRESFSVESDAALSGVAMLFTYYIAVRHRFLSSRIYSSH